MKQCLQRILPLSLPFLLSAGCTSFLPSRSAEDSPALPPATVIVATNIPPPSTISAANAPGVANSVSPSNAVPAEISLQARPAEPRPAIPSAFRQILAVQTFLDRAHYSCGCADGAFGTKTRQALEAWQTLNNLPVTGQLDPPTLATWDDWADAFTTHTVTAEELRALTPVPSTWQGRSEVATLGYETILEYVAEKYHASHYAIRRLNPNVDWPDPPAGTTLTVPCPEGVRPPKAAKLVVSLGAHTIRAYDETGRLIALFPCSIGQNESKRPVGELKVQNCARNPDFTFDPAVFPESGETHKYRIPPGPNNPVGIAWIGLNLTGYGIHGTPHPEDIGKTESHGCFRLANWNAGKLLRMIQIGTPVIVEP